MPDRPPVAHHTAGEEAEATAELAETAIGRTEPARPYVGLTPRFRE